MKYVCTACGFVYDEEKGDPDNGIAPGTKFEDLPEDYVCPWCGMGKDAFAKEQQHRKMRKLFLVFFCCLENYNNVLLHTEGKKFILLFLRERQLVKGRKQE